MGLPATSAVPVRPCRFCKGKIHRKYIQCAQTVRILGRAKTRLLFNHMKMTCKDGEKIFTCQYMQ